MKKKNAENSIDNLNEKKPDKPRKLSKSLYRSMKHIDEPKAFRAALIKKADDIASQRIKPKGYKVAINTPSKKEEKVLAKQLKLSRKNNLPVKPVTGIKRPIFKIFVTGFAVCVLVGIVVIGIFATWMAQAPAIDTSKFEFASATTIYDNTGNVYQQLQGSEMRIPVEIEEIPEIVQLAFVAIEDQRFYSHFGVDIRGTLKAVVSVLTSGSTDGPGGSTITQQLIKQTHLTSAVSIKRKVMEWYLSVKLENLFDKREILEAYLNKVNMSDAWGIEGASEYYFGLSVDRLSIAQAAVLAAIINSPSYYNPYDYDEDEDGNVYLVKTKAEDGTVVIGYSPENFSRASDVVDKMYELGYISSREYEIASADLAQNRIKLIVPESVETYTYFTDAVYQQVIADLISTYNYSDDDATELLLNGGLHIYSTVDTAVQDALELYASKNSNFPAQSSTAAAASKALSNLTGVKTSLIPQVGGAVVENATGYVVGIIGGRSKSVSLSLNRGLTPYQVGSTTKPISVYAPGIETGRITLATTFDNSRYYFSGGWRPVNHGGGYTGMMTVREGLRTSTNIVAVLAQMRIGDETCANYAEKFGLTITRTGVMNDLNASALALGGYVNGQTPLAMASAYTTFPNGGWRYTPTFYTHVTDSNGVVIMSANQQKVQVISEQTAWLVTSVLKQVVRGGTTYRSVSGQEIGGKTGTTDSQRCVWFCGFTPKYSGAFWFGYDYNALTVNGVKYDLYINSTSGSYYSPAAFWELVFNRFYKVKGLSSQSLPGRPGRITAATVDAESGMLPGENTQKTVSDYFIYGTVPGTVDDMHQKFTVCSVTGKFPNEFCATVEKVIFVKDDSRLLPAGARRLDESSESKEPKEDEPCTVCTAESTGANIYGVKFDVTSVSLVEGTSTSLILKDSLGNLLNIGQVNVGTSSNGISAYADDKMVYISGIRPGNYTLTASLLLNVGTSKETTYVTDLSVTVTAAPVIPGPDPDTDPDPEP